MSPRRYDNTKRRAAAEATRQRIVQATFEVHGEQGIAGARLDDIAARAGVSIATLYRHFPSYEHLVDACGDLTFELFPLPTAAEADEALTGVTELDDRVERLVDRLHSFYEQTGPTVQLMRTDARAVAAVGRRLEVLEDGIAAWLARALADVPPERRPIVAALVDHRTWTALSDNGVDDTRGVVAQLVRAALG